MQLELESRLQRPSVKMSGSKVGDVEAAQKVSRRILSFSVAGLPWGQAWWISGSFLHNLFGNRTSQFLLVGHVVRIFLCVPEGEGDRQTDRDGTRKRSNK